MPLYNVQPGNAYQRAAQTMQSASSTMASRQKGQTIKREYDKGSPIIPALQGAWVGAGIGNAVAPGVEKFYNKYFGAEKGTPELSIKGGAEASNAPVQGAAGSQTGNIVQGVPDKLVAPNGQMAGQAGRSVTLGGSSATPAATSPMTAAAGSTPVTASTMAEGGALASPVAINGGASGIGGTAGIGGISSSALGSTTPITSSVLSEGAGQAAGQLAGQATGQLAGQATGQLATQGAITAGSALTGGAATAGGAASATTAGATAGSAAGPIGTAIGAGVGALLGLASYYLC